ARGTRGALGFKDGSTLPLAGERLRQVERPLPDGRDAVGAQAGLREPRQLGGERKRSIERLAVVAEPVGEANGKTFLRVHLAAGEDQVHRTAVADDARQAD